MDVLRRLVPTGSGGMKRGYAGYAAVLGQIAAAPLWTGTDWDFYFGGRPNPNLSSCTGVDSTGNPVVDLLTWAIPPEQLAGEGGVVADLLITAQVVTTVTSLADPTPISDLVQVGVFLAQGQNGQAGVALAGAAIPGGFDKLAALAKNIPVDKMIAAGARHADGLAATGRVIGNAGENRGFAGEIIRFAKQNDPPAGMANHSRPLEVGDVLSYGEYLEQRLPGSSLRGHHVPQQARLREVGVDPNQGTVVVIGDDVHRQTRTYGGRGARTAREEAGLPLDVSQERDIDDLAQLGIDPAVFQRIRDSNQQIFP